MTKTAIDLAREVLGDQPEVCPRCEGKGFEWRVPDGFNPFYAGAINTANASYKILCRNQCPWPEQSRSI